MKKYADILDSLRLGGNLRTIPEECVAEAVTDFSSNDYLGLAARPELQEEFFADPQRRRIPMTSSASRLLSAASGNMMLSNVVSASFTDGLAC